MKKSEYNFKMTKDMWKYVFSSLVMGAAVLYMDNAMPIRGILLTIIEILAGMCVYFILLILMKDDVLISALKKMRR